LGTLLKITNAESRRINCHEKNSSDIAASQPKVRPLSDWVQISRSEEGTKCNKVKSGASFALIVLFLEVIDVFTRRLQSQAESSNDK
jgi:hypothetical protein